MISDYDRNMSQLTPTEKKKWAHGVNFHIGIGATTPGEPYVLTPLPKERIIVLAGDAYTKPLRRYDPQNHNWSLNYLSNIEEPLKGKQIGERLRWFNTQEKAMHLNDKLTENDE